MATLDMVVASLKNYLNKIQAKLDGGGGGSKGDYTTGTIAAGGTVVYDAPTRLGFVVADVNIYSIGLDLKKVDNVNTNPISVVPGIAELDYSIGTDGKVTIRNWSASAVTYHLLATAPVKK